MLGTLLAAALILAASFAVGQAICALVGLPGWPAYGGAVGLATLMAIASLGVSLPGDATTAALLAGLVSLVAVVLLVRARRAPPLAAALAVLVVFAAAWLPFWASGRMGVPGVSLNNDTAVHLLWSEALRSDRMASLYPLSSGYPTGPHALMAALAQATGIRMDRVLAALLMSLYALLGATALAGLRGLGPWRRALGAVVVGGAYLVTAYYGQGAFKELAQALFLLAFTLAARDVAALRLRGRRAFVAGIPLALLAAGCVYVYSYLGLAWPVAAAAAWAGLGLAGALLRTRSLPATIVVARNGIRYAWPVAAAAAIALLLAAGPVLERTLNYFRQVGTSVSGSGGIAVSNIGNLPGPISPFESLGLWPGYDFRFGPANGTTGALLAAIGLGAAVYGLIWWLRRRDPWLAGTALASFLIYAASRHSQSPYVAAKGLAIVAPVIVLVAVRALLDGPRPRSLPALGRAAVAAAFVLGALASSLYALRGTFVGTSSATAELAMLRPRVENARTLFLGLDDYVGWKLRDVPLGYVPTGFPPPLSVALRTDKHWTYGQPLDVDSVTPASLDRFAYVIEPRTGYASSMPANFRLSAQTRSFQLWRRTGPTPARRVVEQGAPGATLRCGSKPPSGRAAVMAAPVLNKRFPPLAPGGSATVPLRLKPGRWRLSLQYTSGSDLTVEAAGRRFSMPARLDRPGPFFDVGAVSADGPILVTVHVKRASFLTSRVQAAFVSAVAATRPGPRRVVPARQACGRYVDWLEAASR